jgi:hypothetical protein
MDALNLATSTYQSLLQESDDERLSSRAHYGLARAYELRNELDKARDEYLAVKGAFAPLAERRAKELQEQDLKETYDWLATARAPQRAPLGPGTPGERPDFAPGELEMPAGESGTVPSVDDLFQGLGLPESTDDTDRYGTGDETAGDETAGESDAKSDDAAKENAAESKE